MFIKMSVAKQVREEFQFVVCRQLCAPLVQNQSHIDFQYFEMYRPVPSSGGGGGGGGGGGTDAPLRFSD